MTELEEFDLSTTEYEWLKVMEKKYKYTDLKVIEEGDTTIDQHPAFWHVIELRFRGSPRKEKIYLVQGDKFYYRIRLTCRKRYFDKDLEEFKQLVKSFKLLPFKPPVIPKVPIYITNRRKRYQFQKLGKVWAKETTKFNDYKFVIKADYSTIFVGSDKYTTAPGQFDLPTAQSSWINMRKEKYNWTDLVITEQNETTIAEHPALYTIFEYRSDRAAVKHKCKMYFVKGDKYYYRLGLWCLKPYFDDHLEEFEQLVKSFKLL